MSRALRFRAVTILGLLGLWFNVASARAQSDTAVPAQNPDQPTSSAAESQTAEKKVWTNDDFHRAHPRRDASAATNSNTKPAGEAGKAQIAASGKNAAWYRGQISKLQGQIPPLDQKIEQLQAALNGQQVDAPRVYGWSKPADWHTQLTQYQKQREDIEAKIDALEDRARHDGVPENEIR